MIAMEGVSRRERGAPISMILRMFAWQTFLRAFLKSFSSLQRASDDLKLYFLLRVFVWWLHRVKEGEQKRAFIRAVQLSFVIVSLFSLAVFGSKPVKRVDLSSHGSCFRYVSSVFKLASRTCKVNMLLLLVCELISTAVTTKILLTFQTLNLQFYRELEN